MASMPTEDPIARELFGLAWKRTIATLPAPPRIGSGPATQDEYLALMRTLAEFADGIEANLLAVMDQAATFFHVPHAAIGRACGISRQAVRQRLVRRSAAIAKRRNELLEREKENWEE